MTADNVLQFTRPPVRQSTIVRADRERTFDVFLDRLAEWWPLDPFSYGGSERIARITVEHRTGGAVTEHWHDGSSREWGHLLDWAPPHGFTMTWNITGQPTEVELRFTALPDGTTRVDLEHRGWDRLSAEELVAACALPGGYAGGAFNEGWATILRGLKEHLER
ncbi:activator of Hsp90 ATPase-like protein [Diaminobutyricimonas aerilata]|uniref:Activator of Hsp90 ATPase-like protein n=1 Tax=Diaminobutyricimonas aerilata TaxID=1162967 RepID=A0A2M9CJR8_9MICO|nr:SRPBCC domain-containing protein [Diaminobutyricimonas aerilata]PJJ72139.1 activator of Hsp90 ATPase-like protein [Diaminobutyricimonas aerilata]